MEQNGFSDVSVRKTINAKFLYIFILLCLNSFSDELKSLLNTILFFTVRDIEVT